jgi:hypothetical protein
MTSRSACTRKSRLKVSLNVARSPDEAERQAKGENVIAAGQAADKAADDEAAKEIAAAAQPLASIAARSTADPARTDPTKKGPLARAGLLLSG